MENDVATTKRKLLLFETPPITRLALGKSTFPRRKFSFPTVLHENSPSSSSSTTFNNHLDNIQASNNNINSKRRFSHVGDVVSRKLSNTIGWRSVSVPTDEVVAQGRVLCAQFIRNRLKRSGIFNKKLGLYRYLNFLFHH